MRRLAMVPVLSFACACGHGAMGQAVFSSGCRAEDSACDKKTFDAPIAVGASVEPEVRLDLRGSGAPAAHFAAVGDEVISAERGLLRGKKPGVAAVLLRTDTGTVLDFFHVWVKSPTHLKLFELTGADVQPEPITTPLELLEGESVRLAASLFGDGQPLAGRAEQAWSTDNAVIAVLGEGRPDRRRIVAVAPGRATLRIRSLDQTTFVDVIVHAARPGALALSHQVKK